MTNETMAKCIGILIIVSVTFGELKTKIDFLVFKDVPVEALICILERERLSAQIDLGGQYVDSTVAGESV